MRKTKLIIATLAIPMKPNGASILMMICGFTSKTVGSMQKTNGFRMKTVHGIGLMMVVHCPHGLVWQPMAAFTIQPENI